MTKYKVLYIIFDLDVAGAQTNVMNYLRQLDGDPEFEAVVAIVGDYKGTDYEIECKDKGYKVFYCHYKAFIKIPGIRSFINWFRCQYVISREIRRIKPDVLHSHQTVIIPFVTLPFVLSRVKPRFHTIHSDPNVITKYRASWARFAFKYCNIYPVCVTEDQAWKAKKRYHIKDFSVIHNGIDLSRYSISESKEEVRKSIRIPEKAFVVGCVARFSKIKNFDFLLKVFFLYHSINQDAILLLVGDGEEKKHIVELANELNILDSIVFTGQRKDVERMYKTMDVFMLTSFSESSSIVTVEAQLVGVRCVVSEGVPSDVIITDQVNRLSLDAPIDVWVDAIKGNVPKESNVYSKEKFSISDSVDELKGIYKRKLENANK